MTSPTPIYSHQVADKNGAPVSLEKYKGQVLLVLNTASKCGFTPQYAELEALYQKYKDKGFNILAFPCNQFGAQEPGSDAEIQEFCQLNFGVTFPVFAKIEVNGPQTHPLFDDLKEQCPGVLSTKMIKWNFTKFLIDRNGVPVARFGPTTKPSELEAVIEEYLAKT